MSRLSIIEEKINRLVEKCRDLEAESSQNASELSEAKPISEEVENELSDLREKLVDKDEKLKQIASKMEKLENLVKDL